MIYSDDALFRIYVGTPAEIAPTLCTLDIMYYMEKLGLLSVTEVAEKIATLCLWHVGVYILPRYQIAILPDNLADAASVQEGIDCIQKSQLCSALFTGIWDARKPYQKIQEHAASILKDLISDPRNNVRSISALIGYWYLKARLRVDSKVHPPLRRIVQVILQVLISDKSALKDAAHRLWEVYLSIVEIEHGKHMDESKEYEAVYFIGKIAAEADLEHSLAGAESMYELLGKGLTDGTKNFEIFRKAYTEYRVSKIVYKKKHR